MAEPPDSSQSDESQDILATGQCATPLPVDLIQEQSIQGWLLLYVTQGSARLQLDVGHEAISTGDLLIFEPGGRPRLGDDPGRRCEISWCGFLPRSGWFQHLVLFPEMQPGVKSLRIRDAHANKRLRSAFSRLLEDSKMPREIVNRNLSLNAVGEMMGLATREHYRIAGLKEPSAEIFEVIHHIGAHLNKPHTVAGLAKVAHLSPSRFAHRFKEEIGESVLAFLMRLRLAKAAQLLTYTRRTAKEVCQLVGFKTQSHFNVQFKRQFQMTPREYKRRMGVGSGRL